MALRFFEIAFAEVSQGIMAVSADNTILLANRAAHATFLYAPGELVGQSIDRVLPNRWVTSTRISGSISG